MASSRRKRSTNAAIITLLILNLSLHCTPAAIPLPNFYSTLYQQDAQRGTCRLLPKVTDSDEGFMSAKMNSVCQSSPTNEKEKASPICQSTVDLFSNLCKLTSSTSEQEGPKVNTTVDLNKANALGVENFCRIFIEVFQNVSKGSPEMWSSEFQGQKEDQVCKDVCKNNQSASISGDDKFQVNPICILLYEGYNVYQQASSSQSNKSQPNSQSNNESAAGIMSSSSGHHNREGVTESSNLKSGHSGVVPAESEVAAQDEKSKPVINSSDHKENLSNPGGMKPSDAESVNNPATKLNLSSDSSSSSSKQPQQEASQGIGNLSSTSSTSSSVINNEAPGPGDMPKPIDTSNDQKLKSSTAISTDTEIGKPDVVQDQSSIKKDQKMDSKPSPELSPQVDQQQGNNPQQDAKEDSKKSEKDNNNKAPSEDYVNGEQDSTEYEDAGNVKQNGKTDTQQDAGGDGTGNKNKESFNGNGFMAAPFDRGTTLNVTVNENQDTGFFNYFLFCATLVGLLYFILHNKKRLIAYVVEGRRPRSRSRRNSASSQYRRLENNFD